MTVDLADAAGMALAEPVRSTLTLPPWPNSAMDGFAVRSVDLADADSELTRATLALFDLEPQ